MARGAIFEVTTYIKEEILYGKDIRKVEET